MIDFTLTPDLEDLRLRIRAFVDEVVNPAVDELDPSERQTYVSALLELRRQAREAALWLPHMPTEWGGMGLGHVEMAMVQSEAARSYYGPWVLNCQAPDEGNMHTLLHWGSEAQQDRYLRGLCEGRLRSCFAMTEPEVAELHAAHRVDRGLDFSAEVSMAKHFVANALNRIIDRSIQVHGALGYSTDTPLASMYQHARWARFADGADEVHQMRIAQRTIAAYRRDGSTRAATGDLPL